MKKPRVELLTYILSIVFVNIIFLYVRQFFDNKSLITIFHVGLGSLQLVLLTPKIIKIVKDGNLR